MRNITMDFEPENRGQDYGSFGESVEASGALAKAIVEGFGVYGYIASSILAKNGIEAPYENKWYPLENFRAAFNQIEEQFGHPVLYFIGRKLIQSSEGFAGVSVEEALAAINDFYSACHRKGYVGEFKLEQLSKNEAILVCRNPYPKAFNEGYISGLFCLLRRFDADIAPEPFPSSPAARPTAVYRLKW